MSIFEMIINHVNELAPLHKKQLDKVIEHLTIEEIISAERMFNFFINKMQYSIKDIANAYLWFINTYLEAQIEFFRTGNYPHSTFAEIESYYKDMQMMKNYAVSLATTLYLFPQHIKVNRFFKNVIKQPIESYSNACYLEIGPGHGHLFVTAMENCNYDNYIAIDISQTSVDMTKAYIEYCIPNKKNWRVEHKDCFNFDSKDKFDAIVMGEVLEHVENPSMLLKNIRSLANDDAFIYITTAINAPCFDHIYHFKTVGEVEQLFHECGLAVKDKTYGIANKVDINKAINKKYSIVPAYVLKKI